MDRRRAIEKGEALERLIIEARDYWDRMVINCKRLDELCHKRDTTLRIKNKDVYLNKVITDWKQIQKGKDLLSVCTKVLREGD